MLKVEQRGLLPSPPLPPQVLIFCLSFDLTFDLPSSFSATHFLIMLLIHLF